MARYIFVCIKHGKFLTPVDDGPRLAPDYFAPSPDTLLTEPNHNIWQIDLSNLACPEEDYGPFGDGPGCAHNYKIAQLLD